MSSPTSAAESSTTDPSPSLSSETSTGPASSSTSEGLLASSASSSEPQPTSSPSAPSATEPTASASPSSSSTTPSQSPPSSSSTTTPPASSSTTPATTTQQSTSSSTAAPPPSSSSRTSSVSAPRSSSPPGGSSPAPPSSSRAPSTTAGAATTSSATTEPVGAASSAQGFTPSDVASSAEQPTSRAAILSDPESTQTSTTLYTLTSSGQVVVVTSVITTVVRPSGSANGTSTGRSLNGDAGSSRSFFSNTGAVAGTFAAVGLIAAGLVIGLAFFFFRRKKKRQLDEDIRVAAGGAGDGGAGKSRFAGDDDEEDPFAGGPGSEGHHSNGYGPTMSSYGTVPLTAAAAAYAANGAGNRRASYGDGRRSMSSFDQGMQSQGSHPNIAGYNSTIGGGAAAYAGYQAYGPGYGRDERNGAPRSHEGALYPDWAEYIEGETPPGRSSGEGAGSAEGMTGSAENYYSPNNYARGSDSSHYPSAVPSVAGLSQPVPGATTADERLDPNMGLGNVANGSQTSLGDENDYSRKRILRVANPGDE